MAKKKLSELELILKKLGFVAKTYTDEQVAANAVHIIEQGTAESGYLKTYIFAKGVTLESEVTQDNLIGKVNIPKDFLVTAVKRVTVEAGTGALEGKWVIVSENGTAVTPSILSVAWNLSELIDVYTGGNGIDVTNNVITIDLDANGGLEFTGSTDGAKKLAIKIDSSNANGLALTSAGLKLDLATPSTAGVGGTNGAMSAQDKENLDKLNIALCSDAEIGSWFGYASNSTMVTTTLPAVSDDSIEDE